MEEAVDDGQMIQRLLEPGEALTVTARATEAVLAVTDRRVIVAANQRSRLALGISEVRRIQFDIERDRPATLVIVPDSPAHAPQVLAIPIEELALASQALAIIGQRLNS
jgi:hypothetical protein